MGITPSKDSFKQLEGYANKSNDERNEILTRAGLQLGKQDKEIAEFLNTDIIFGGFIGGIITVCLVIQANEHQQQWQTQEQIIRQEAANYYSQTIEKLQIQLNNINKIMVENENNYYSKINPKAHVVYSEKGVQEPYDVQKYNENNNTHWKELQQSSSSFAYSETSKGTLG
jgi:hypothetical protein